MNSHEDNDTHAQTNYNAGFSDDSHPCVLALQRADHRWRISWDSLDDLRAGSGTFLTWWTKSGSNDLWPTASQLVFWPQFFFGLLLGKQLSSGI